MTAIPHITKATDWFDHHYGAQVSINEIAALRHARLAKLSDDAFKLHRNALAHAPELPSQAAKLSEAAVTVGPLLSSEDPLRAQLEQALKVFSPWKKGPFSLFGVDIDAEWRSDWKWDRVKDQVSLKGQRVADIGCNNGYYMFRMAHEHPECVVGFEPFLNHVLVFELLQQYLETPSLVFEPLGAEHVDLYPQFFDTIFMMGILYHHTDPVGLLRKARAALRPKGVLVIDCQGIAGEEPMALVPKNRYAGANGIWWIPTRSAVEHWISRAGFSSWECFYQAPLSTEEQRATHWAPIKSLQDFLDPQDAAKTIEGYPAPWRFYFRCVK